MLNLLRVFLAMVMWRLQRSAILRWLWGWGNLAGGRHVDWQPYRCEECGWTGPLRWCWHTYGDGGDGDAEPVDECRKCGSDKLFPIE